MKVTWKSTEEVKLETFASMRGGDIGFIRNSSLVNYNGKLVMKCYNYVFSLEQTPTYWSEGANHQVELLRPGSQVILTVE